MLKNLPKHYNPPGNGRRDMESLAYINEQEREMLKMHGGMGTMTKHGIRSYWLGDHANSLGSAGGSNWAGDGKGGQVNMDHAGPGTGNGLRQVDGQWQIHNIATGQRIGNDGKAYGGGVVSAPRTVMAPVAAVPKPMMKPAVPVAAPVAPSVALDPQIMGRLQAALTPKPAVQSTFPARPSVISSNVARPSVADAAPLSGFASSFPSRPSAISSNVTKSKSVPAGQKVTDVFGPKVDQDPSIAGRLSKAQPVASMPEGPRTDRMATPQNFTSMAAEAAARAAANRSRVPAGAIPTPRQNPLRDTSKIRTDSTFNANTDFGMIEGPTLSRLAALQDRFGKPITVTEGAAPIGTHVSKSQHHINPATGKADALDLSVATGDRAQLASLANAVGFGGIGAYNSFPNMVHVDNGAVRSWGPGGKSKNIAQLNDVALRDALVNRERPVMASDGPPPPHTIARALGINPTAGPPEPQKELSVADVAPSFWEQGKNLVNAGYQTFTDANKKINAAGGGKAVQGLAKLAQMFQGDGSGKQYISHEQGHGGQGGLKNLPQSSKPKAVAGPTPPKPGFTWVQWTPGSPPTQIPTNALIGAA